MRKIFLLLLPIFLFAEEGRLHEEIKGPELWATGPLITPSASVVQGGHFNLEPYLYSTANTAEYGENWEVVDAHNFFTISNQPSVQVGLTEWLDFQFTPVLSWNHHRNAAHWALGDIVTEFQIGLRRDPFPSNSVLPSFSITLRETLPIGKYRNFTPNKEGTQGGGLGSWITGVALGASKAYHVTGHQFFVYRVNLQCDFYHTPVHVTGINVYGGGQGTDGRVKPGKNAQIQLGFEYLFTQSWGLDLDVVGIWNGSNRFKGNSGRGLHGLPAVNGTRASVQWSLAPAIEYNWNANLGLIAGVWFTVAGKNTNKFTSGVIALNYFK